MGFIFKFQMTLKPAYTSKSDVIYYFHRLLFILAVYNEMQIFQTKTYNNSKKKIISEDFTLLCNKNHKHGKDQRQLKSDH